MPNSEHDMLKNFAEINNIKAKEAHEIINDLDLDDIAKLGQAIENDDTVGVKKIYKDALSSNDEHINIIDFYNKALEDTDDSNEALALSADEFGITGEEVMDLIKSKTNENVYINAFDKKINKIKNTINNAYTNKDVSINETFIADLNSYEIGFLLEKIDDVPKTIIEAVLALSPEKIMKKHAMISGYKNMFEEYSMPNKTMTDKIISYYLKKIDTNKLKKNK